MSAPDAQVIEADLTCVNGQFRSGVRIAVSPDGRILQVGSPAAATQRLTGRALLPGLINAHSHAFQRGLRGRGERFPAGAGDFWTWREAMYALVESLTPAALGELCEQAFREMLACGVTTVAEFHYLHHEQPPELDFSLDRIVLEAARRVGIRLVLLVCYYRTGGVGRPLGPAQRRFATPAVDRFLAHIERLERQLDPRTQTIGLAPHSVRAVPGDDLRVLCDAAAQRGWPVHMHLEEQPAELEECQAVYGRAPIDWVLDTVAVGPRFTAIHATHAPPERLRRWLETGAGICLCPITEASLGDGIADVAAMLASGGRLCVGSDSNVRIDLIEELRWLELAQRLRTRSRGACTTVEGDVAARLLSCATRDAAAALGLAAGAIAPGLPADFFTVDLDHPALHGWTPDTLLATLLLGAGGDCVREVCVAGDWRSVRG